VPRQVSLDEALRVCAERCAAPVHGGRAWAALVGWTVEQAPPPAAVAHAVDATGSASPLSAVSLPAPAPEVPPSVNVYLAGVLELRLSAGSS
jgi:hypothetical protein